MHHLRVSASVNYEPLTPSLPYTGPGLEAPFTSNRKPALIALIPYSDALDLKDLRGGYSVWRTGDPFVHLHLPALGCQAGRSGLRGENTT